ncbi:MAG: hypothetical protein ACT4TC_24240, partial [Myxococcaceae bacterium]
EEALLGDGCALGPIQQGKLGQGFGMVFDPNGELIFADTPNHRILRVGFGGVTYAVYESPDFLPTQLTLGSDGTIFVVDATTRKLIKLTP